MCGITGIFQRDGRPVDPALLKAMTRSLAHRGPDGEGIWCQGEVGLGHRRLAIRDPSEAGRQPMSDPDGTVWVSFNGEIYNDASLRNELECRHDFCFHSDCDAELLPAAWLAWGEGMFERLQGMFALALWDRRQQRLLLARDGAGIKPLFFSVNREVVRFASEPKALLVDPRQDRSLDPQALLAYLAQGYVSPQRTLMGSVEQLPPGSAWVFEAKGQRQFSFWQARRTPVIRDPEEALEAFLPLWQEVVEDHTVSDVPVGVQQSGGIDSSLVTLSLRGHPGIPAFTARFDERSHDEFDLAAGVCRAAGLRHVPVPVQVGEDDADTDTFRRVVYHFDGQLADSSAFAVYRLCREIRHHVKVVLSGDGADEYFGGYPTYRASRLASRLQPLVPRAVAGAVASALFRIAAASESRLPSSEVMARFCLGLAAPTGASHAFWRSLMSRDTIRSLCGPALVEIEQQLEPLQGYIGALGDAADGPLLDRCLLADQRFYLPSDMLMKVDAMSMAHGLEVRVPFLDRRVMDFAGQLHTDLLLPRHGPAKAILRRAARQLGAPAPVWQGRKWGFNVPVSGLLRGSLSGLAEALLVHEAGRLEPWLEPSAVRSLWQAHRERRANHGYALWALLSFAVWLQQLERGLPPSMRE